MFDVLYVVFFVLIFGVVFVGFILVEWGYICYKGLNSVYYFKEILVNIGIGFFYKMVDGIVIVLFI